MRIAGECSFCSDSGVESGGKDLWETTETVVDGGGEDAMAGTGEGAEPGGTPAQGVESMLPSAGDMVGVYRIEAVQGSGGMGVVFRATDTTLEREVAIKFLNLDVVHTRNVSPHFMTELKERFLREARLSARISHPNAVQVYAADLGEKAPYMVMEFLHGKGFDEELEYEKTVDGQTVCGIALQVCAALRYAWDSHRIIHRDLKPANLMLLPDGIVKVMDFGIARVVQESTAGTGITMPGMSVGTPQFKSPEQHRGSPDLDCRSDMYTLGLVLYRALVGRYPFQAGNEGKLYQLKMDGLPKGMLAKLCKAPKLMIEMIERLLAPDPGGRYGDYGELDAVLREASALLRAGDGTDVAESAFLGAPALMFRLQSVLERVLPGNVYGKYEVRRLIGHGGMGGVFEGVDTKSGTSVALKFLASTQDTEESMSHQLWREVDILRRLSHPSIVQILDFQSGDGLDYLVMELLLGPSGDSVNLMEYAKTFGAKTGLLDGRDMKQISLSLLAAIGFAHRHGVLHCDLKPENVLFECVRVEDGKYWEANLKLTDFGLAKVIGEDVLLKSVNQSIACMTRGLPEDPSVPDAAALMGTYEYMSPEQRRGEPATARCDIFAVGMIILRLLTGAKHLGFRQKPSILRPGIHPGWDGVVMKALREHAEDRYASVDEMIEDIDKL